MAIRDVGRTRMAHGLGRSGQRPPMGEPADGLAIIRGLHAGYKNELQHQGRGHRVRREAGVRVVRTGTAGQKIHAQGVREQLFARAREVEAYQDEVSAYKQRENGVFVVIGH